MENMSLRICPIRTEPFQRQELRKDFLGRFLNLSSNKWRYYLIACLLMPASILCAMAISLLFGYSPSQFIITGHYTFTSGVFPVWFLLILAPTLEELAWHGYGIDCLRSRMSLFNTSMLFAAYWAIWHFPLAGIKGYYHANVMSEGWLYSLNFIVSIFPFVILMNWLYYKTNRNILVAIIFHITAGYFNEIFATHPDSKCIQTVLLLIVSAVIVVKEHRLFFNRALEELTLGVNVVSLSSNIVYLVSTEPLSLQWVRRINAITPIRKLV